MIKYIIGLLSTFIIWIISLLGYWGIILAMAIESACIPLPSEVIMPFGGYLVVTKVFGSIHGDIIAIFYVALAGAFGCVIGSVIAYWVGLWGGRPFLEKYGKFVLISKADIDNADRWCAKYGNLAVLISRMLPVIRTFISLPAGIMKMNFKIFIAYTFIGSLPWCFILAWIGYKIGQNVSTIIEWTNAIETKLGKFMHIIDAFIILGCILLAVWFLKKHLGSKETKPI
ncbi:MAG: DedA family protein [Elusimicrobia bacterium]|nr:DedA family protein [Candidatus Liberimonas magnetica]